LKLYYNFLIIRVGIDIAGPYTGNSDSPLVFPNSFQSIMLRFFFGKANGIFIQGCRVRREGVEKMERESHLRDF
jgi:hypothetical protein